MKKLLSLLSLSLVLLSCGAWQLQIPLSGPTPNDDSAKKARVNQRVLRMIFECVAFKQSDASGATRGHCFARFIAAAKRGLLAQNMFFRRRRFVNPFGVQRRRGPRWYGARRENPPE